MARNWESIRNEIVESFRINEEEIATAKKLAAKKKKIADIAFKIRHYCNLVDFDDDERLVESVAQIHKLSLDLKDYTYEYILDREDNG